MVPATVQELPMLSAVTALALWQLTDGVLSRLDAVVLLSVFAALGQPLPPASGLPMKATTRSSAHDRCDELYKSESRAPCR